jgi:uncharacterized protein YyaL (SSP411 family)
MTVHTNRLSTEKSPYLLQHAHNPVDWYPWGPDAFAKASTENKPIFLSVGYSTCHWCHVMERESFESEQVAEILNRDFVAIKVDREERPDVDRVYMLFVQATTGGGGWPMSVWLTPDLKPFYGGTYFPPDNRYGRPSFQTVLKHIAQAWRDDRDRIEESVAGILSQLTDYSAIGGTGAVPDTDAILESGLQHLRRTFDQRHGGFGGAPKFPRPVQLNFLMRYWAATGNREALDMTVATLKAMARGGMNDQLGGGFHRYSVDARWFVPHFEKMLYDQAQLAISYLEAYQVTKEEALAAEACRIFDYVLRDMTDAEGGFHSAEDADSVIDPARPEHKGEGAFYVFEWKELETVLGGEAASFAECFGCRPEGNVSPHEDPHEEFTGKNILFRAVEPMPPFAEARAKLLACRGVRVRPHLDDKVLTAWNGLMISAFALGARVLSNSRYADAARKAADFLHATLWHPGRKVLLRRWRSGEASINGFLDDYAFFAQGLLDLHETSFEKRDLDLAIVLADRMRELFEDRENGAFFSTTDADTSLVLRLKEDYDGAEPSGNAIAAMVLLRLAAMTGRAEYKQSAIRTLSAFRDRMERQTAAVPQMVCALLFSRQHPRQIVFHGADPEPLIAVVHRKFAPFEVLLRGDRLEGPAEAHICEDFVCHLPVSDPEELARQVE